MVGKAIAKKEFVQMFSGGEGKHVNGDEKLNETNRVQTRVAMGNVIVARTGFFWTRLFKEISISQHTLFPSDWSCAL